MVTPARSLFELGELIDIHLIVGHVKPLDLSLLSVFLSFFLFIFLFLACDTDSTPKSCAELQVTLKFSTKVMATSAAFFFRLLFHISDGVPSFLLFREHVSYYWNLLPWFFQSVTPG